MHASCIKFDTKKNKTPRKSRMKDQIHPLHIICRASTAINKFANVLSCITDFQNQHCVGEQAIWHDGVYFTLEQGIPACRLAEDVHEQGLDLEQNVLQKENVTSGNRT